MKNFAWWLATGLLGVLAIFAQLDRASARRPELALAVPEPFRSAAQVPVTALALTQEDATGARDEAEKLVYRRPIPAEHLFLLATAELKAGRFEKFSRAFELSTERGWRFRPIQNAAARAALDAGDIEGAANRIAALWALGADKDTHDLTRRLLSLKEGRGAFEKRIGASRVWSAEGQRFLDGHSERSR